LKLIHFLTKTGYKNNKLIRIEVKTGWINNKTGNLSYAKAKNREYDLIAVCIKGDSSVVYFNKNDKEIDISL